MTPEKRRSQEKKGIRKEIDQLEKGADRRQKNEKGLEKPLVRQNVS